jgi:seryl-tRNA synthetase
MLDFNFVCENVDLVAQNCANRGVPVDLSNLVTLRQKRSELITAGDQLRSELKTSSGLTAKAKDQAERQALIAKGKELGEKIAVAEAALAEVEAQVHEALQHIPNMTHPDAPVGELESASKVIRTWGEIPKFDFKPLDHVELAAKHDLIDLEGGARVAGHGFYFLKNEAVLLEMALVQYALHKLRAEGFVLHSTPDLAKQEVLMGTGYNPRGNETQIYSITGTDLSLVATAEITLGGLLKDHVIDYAKLPLKYAGLSHCFRTEAGAHGKATRGIYRVHQFTKVEIFGFTAPDVVASDAFHLEILRIEEEIFQGLGLPYHVLDIGTGDLGGPAYRKFDIECWMPGRNAFGEVTSASNCTDYQSRRLAIRTKVPDKKGTAFVHTLNGTAVAISRALVAVLENYQQADGSILIPEVLRKWVGQDKIG